MPRPLRSSRRSPRCSTNSTQSPPDGTPPMSGRISTLATPLQQEYLLQAMNSQLNTLTAEASSGLKVNPSSSMGNGAALLYNLQMQADQQNTLQTTATNAGNRLDAVQTALTSIGSAVQPIA